MLNKKYFLVLIFSVFIFSSCFDENDYGNSKQDNFELLWKEIDEKYCFFEYKNIDWDNIHTEYKAQVSEGMSQDAFFDLMGQMLAELKDGHVNLIANHNMSRYWKWFEDYPENFDSKIQKNYIGTDYLIAGGLKYKVLPDSVGYVYYSSFSSGVGENNLDQALYRMAKCKGIIIDIRDNGGGLLTNVDKIASRFFEEETTVGYIMYKTGPAHDSFSKPYERTVKPSDRIRYNKNVVVLTNRKCYSAANDFVNAMTYAPKVTIIGDKTGGGSGLPFSSELTNGWSVRFSSSPMLNANKEQIEFGIDPDIKVDMEEQDMQKGVDTIIETAIKYLLDKEQ